MASTFFASVAALAVGIDTAHANRLATSPTLTYLFEKLHPDIVNPVKQHSSLTNSWYARVRCAHWKLNQPRYYPNRGKHIVP